MIKCPVAFDTDFGRKLVEALGGNSQYIQENWCWDEFGEQYPELRRKAEAYFAAAKSAIAAYYMCTRCGSKREWAEGVIAAAKTGDPAMAAYYMCRSGDDNTDYVWATKVIEAARVGDPSWAAYSMCYRYGNQKWAEGVIAEAKTGNPALAAYYMCRECGSKREWAEGVIAAAKTGDPEWAARRMFADCGSSRAWLETVGGAK